MQPCCESEQDGRQQQGQRCGGGTARNHQATNEPRQHKRFPRPAASRPAPPGEKCLEDTGEGATKPPRTNRKTAFHRSPKELHTRPPPGPVKPKAPARPSACRNAAAPETKAMSRFSSVSILQRSIDTARQHAASGGSSSAGPRQASTARFPPATWQGPANGVYKDKTAAEDADPCDHLAELHGVHTVGHVHAEEDARIWMTIISAPTL